MKRNNLVFLVISVLTLLLLSGCATQEQPTPPPGGIISGASLNETAAGKRDFFSISIKKDGDPLSLDFRGALKEGQVTLVLSDKEQKTVYSRTVSGPTFNMMEFKTLPAGDYVLGLSWDKPVQGSFNLEWYPEKIVLPALSPIILLPGIGMTLVGLAFWILSVRRGGWKYPLWGALFWIVTVALKFGWAVAENSKVYDAINKALPGLTGVLASSLYVGLLTGLTEVLITWLVLRYTRLGKADWKHAFAFGAGFGSVEALLLGLSSLIGMITILSMPDQIPTSAMRSIAAANNIIYGLAPISERFFTIWVHIFCNVLLFYGATVRQSRWLWVSFIFKSLLDAVAGYSQLSGRLDSISFLWLIEGIVIVFGLIAWASSRWVEARYPAAPEPPQAPPALPPSAAEIQF